MTKQVREMYINEVPLKDITQELRDLVLMLYDDCENAQGIKKMKANLNDCRDIISGIDALTYVLNEKANKSCNRNE